MSTIQRWSALGLRLSTLRVSSPDLSHDPALDEDKNEGLAEALELYEAMTPLADADVRSAWNEYRAALSRRSLYAEGAHREGLRIASDVALGMSI